MPKQTIHTAHYPSRIPVADIDVDESTTISELKDILTSHVIDSRGIVRAFERLYVVSKSEGDDVTFAVLTANNEPVATLGPAFDVFLDGPLTDTTEGLELTVSLLGRQLKAAIKPNHAKSAKELQDEIAALTKQLGRIETPTTVAIDYIGLSAPKTTKVNGSRREPDSGYEASGEKGISRRLTSQVDQVCDQQNSHQVYMMGGVEYDCLLNQCNIAANNNKFYVIQVLEGVGPHSSFSLFTRWGRVGTEGQYAINKFSTASEAVAAFNRKYKDKTGNDWAQRADFIAQPGKYTVMDQAGQ